MSRATLTTWVAHMLCIRRGRSPAAATWLHSAGIGRSPLVPSQRRRRTFACSLRSPASHCIIVHLTARPQQVQCAPHLEGPCHLPRYAQRRSAQGAGGTEQWPQAWAASCAQAMGTHAAGQLDDDAPGRAGRLRFVASADKVSTPPLCFRLHSRQLRRRAHEGAATTSAEAKQLMRGQAQIVLIHQLLSKRFCSEVWTRHWYCESYIYARADLKISVATLQRVTKAAARMLEHHEYCCRGRQARKGCWQAGVRHHEAFACHRRAQCARCRRQRL